MFSAMKPLRRIQLSKISLRDAFATVLPVLTMVFAAFWIASQFIKPAPPDSLVMTTGSEDGAYHHFAQRYQARLAEIAEIQLLELDYAEIVPHIFALRLLKHDRSQIQQHLLEANIQTGFHYLPNHTLSLFRTDYPLPVTEEIFPQLLTLPLHPDLSDEQVDFVCQQLEQTLSTCPTTDH